MFLFGLRIDCKSLFGGIYFFDFKYTQNSFSL